MIREQWPGVVSTSASVFAVTTVDEWGKVLCDVRDRVSIGFPLMVSIMLTICMCLMFVVALLSRRFVWVPAILGAFAMALAAIGGLCEGIELCGFIMSLPETQFSAADAAHEVRGILVDFLTGAIAAVMGGLFSVVLAWRASFLREDGTEAGAGAGV